MLTALQGKEEQKEVCTYRRDTQCTYQRDIEARSRNHFCRGKSSQVLHILSVLLALGIQHAMRMRPIVICGLSGSTVFFHIIS